MLLHNNTPPSHKEVVIGWFITCCANCAPVGNDWRIFVGRRNEAVVASDFLLSLRGSASKIIIDEADVTVRRDNPVARRTFKSNMQVQNSRS